LKLAPERIDLSHRPHDFVDVRRRTNQYRMVQYDDAVMCPFRFG
jgi:hypothetical protein